MNESIDDIRLKAWIYSGVELELEMVETQYKLVIAGGTDKTFYQNEIQIQQRKLELVNKRIRELEQRVAA